MRKLLLALVVLSVAGLLAWGVQGILEDRRTRQELQTLQDRVYDARIAIDSCRNELAYQEMLFRRFDTVVASLRGEVETYETMDERGVPEEEYDAYLEVFEGYNDSVDVWEARADSLRTTEAACRLLVEEHNELTDSFRARLNAEGLLGGEDGQGEVPGGG